jgi:hypothetical protein
MAKVQLHPVVTALSGKSGNLVFRQTDGGTILAQQPPPNPDRQWSAAQTGCQTRFQAATAYARSVLADSLQRLLYQRLATERGQTINSILVGDFMNPPVVERIDPSNYSGIAGGAIKVVATDDLEVVSVVVAIRRADESVIEEGPAQKIHGIWVYLATKSLGPGESASIDATACDRPGNRATMRLSVES